jgi:hypothetical protein
VCGAGGRQKRFDGVVGDREGRDRGECRESKVEVGEAGACRDRGKCSESFEGCVGDREGGFGRRRLVVCHHYGKLRHGGIVGPHFH